MNDSVDDQRWLQILGSLSPMSPMSSLVAFKDVKTRWVSTLPEYRHRDSIPNAPCVEILERLSQTSIVLCWADATSGRYGEQTWIMRTARQRGVCSLSGESFHAGDLIYRPNVRQRGGARSIRSISVAAIARLEEGRPVHAMADALSAGQRR